MTKKRKSATAVFQRNGRHLITLPETLETFQPGCSCEGKVEALQNENRTLKRRLQDAETNVSAAKCPKNLLKVVFSTEKLKGRSLGGKKSNARKDSPAKEALDSVRLQAVLSTCPLLSLCSCQLLTKVSFYDRVL
ncbi:hypothetical protein ISCGN_005037 [Ixodes scapularis]